MRRSIVPNVVQRIDPTALSPTDTVRRAIDLMTERGIGCVLVTENTLLVGIFTERDVLTRVAATKLDPDATPLSEVMTADPDTLKPDDRAIDALNLMRARRYRHLPVVEGGVAIAVVSIRDLFETVTSQLETELEERDAMIYGSTRGLA